MKESPENLNNMEKKLKEVPGSDIGYGPTFQVEGYDEKYTNNYNGDIEGGVPERDYSIESSDYTETEPSDVENEIEPRELTMKQRRPLRTMLANLGIPLKSLEPSESEDKEGEGIK